MILLLGFIIGQVFASEITLPNFRGPAIADIPGSTIYDGFRTEKSSFKSASDRPVEFVYGREDPQDTSGWRSIRLGGAEDPVQYQWRIVKPENPNRPAFLPREEIPVQRPTPFSEILLQKLLAAAPQLGRHYQKPKQPERNEHFSVASFRGPSTADSSRAPSSVWSVPRPDPRPGIRETLNARISGLGGLPKSTKQTSVSKAFGFDTTEQEVELLLFNPAVEHSSEHMTLTVDELHSLIPELVLVLPPPAEAAGTVETGPPKPIQIIPRQPTSMFISRARPLPPPTVQPQFFIVPPAPRDGTALAEDPVPVPTRTRGRPSERQNGLPSVFLSSTGDLFAELTGKPKRPSKQCAHNSECWERRANSAISNAVMYDRITGVLCTGCLEACLKDTAKKGPYICRALTYDHSGKVCDLFAVSGKDDPQRITSFPGRDYFRPTGKCGTDGVEKSKSLAEAGYAPHEIRTHISPDLTPEEVPPPSEYKRKDETDSTTNTGSLGVIGLDPEFGVEPKEEAEAEANFQRVPGFGVLPLVEFDDFKPTSSVSRSSVVIPRLRVNRGRSVRRPITGTCRAIRDENGNKLCPHGIRRNSPNKAGFSYCLRPIDCNLSRR